VCHRVFGCAKKYGQERGQMLRAVQTVTSAWAATTVDGIDTGDCNSRSKPIIDPRWCENMYALRVHYTHHQVGDRIATF